MKKTQLKALATKIHGLAVKSASGKKPAQNKALEKIATLLNQAIEAEIKQAYAGIASQVRGLAEKLEPAPARKAVKRKKVTRRKPVVAKKKSDPRREYNTRTPLFDEGAINGDVTVLCCSSRVDFLSRPAGLWSI